MNKSKISVVIYTHERTEDAKINMEIIRSLWSNEFSDIHIVHAYNGEESWYPKQYLEDKLIRMENRGHILGAIDLIETGVNDSLASYDSEYVIVLAADTWCIKPAYISWLINTMQENKLRLATCAWGTAEESNMWMVGVAMDFFIMDSKWARENKVFPIGYEAFVERFGDLLAYTGTQVFPERVFGFKFREILRREAMITLGKVQDIEYWEHVDKLVLKMVEREPVHFKEGSAMRRKNYWPVIGLMGQHLPNPKQEVLKSEVHVKGESIQKLIDATDLSYYNKH